MEVNVFPDGEFVVGPVQKLLGGGFRFFIPPGEGFLVHVNPFGVGAGAQAEPALRSELAVNLELALLELPLSQVIHLKKIN